MQHALVFVNIDGVIQSTSPRFCELMGRPAHELVHEPLATMFAPTMPGFNDCFRQVTYTGAIEDVPLIIKDRFGTLIPIQFSAVSVYDRDHSLLGLHCVLARRDLVGNANEATLAITRERRLREVTLTISSALDIETVLQHVVRLSVELVHADAGAIALLNTDKSKLQTPFIYQLPPHIWHVERPVGVGTVWKAMESGDPLLITSYQHHPQAIPDIVDLGVHTVLTVPIKVGDQIFGVVTLYLMKPTKQFQPRDVGVIEIVARQAGVALQNAQLFAAAEQRAKEAETLRQAGAAVAATLNQTESITRILEHLVRVVPCDTASVQLLHGDYFEIVGGIGFANLSEIIGLRFSIYENSPSAVVYQTKQSVLLRDCQAVHKKFFYPPHDQIRSWLGVPLMIHDQVIGKLAIDSFQVNHFNEHHVRLARAFADQVAIALDNVRLFTEAQQLATTDPLTGVYNRRHFFQLARHQFEQARRYHRPLAAIMFDIDNFKKINDNYGHAVGDQVLCNVACWCEQQLRETDLIGRYGGEEFVIVLPESGMHEAMIVAERLRRGLIEIEVDNSNLHLRVRASFGVAALNDQIENLDTLLNAADQALYTAKNAGRNQVAIQPYEDILPSTSPTAK
jgi:diguanylate cyclase (GGDEF)-like protein